MKIKFAFVLFLCLAFNAFAQNNYLATYEELYSAQRLDELSDLLKKWEAETPSDVELHIAYFNYYMARGYTSQQVVGKRPDGRQAVYNKVFIKKDEADLALKSINRALKIAPDRIDVHIGKMELFQLNSEYDALYSAIASMLERMTVNKNKWLYKAGVTLQSAGKDGEGVIVNAIDRALGSLSYTDEGSNARYKIANLEVKYFPKNVIVLNHLGRALVDKGNFKDGIDAFLKAHKLDSSDVITAMNLAYSYELNKQYKEAIKYYTIVKEIGGRKWLSDAESSIERVKEKMK